MTPDRAGTDEIVSECELPAAPPQVWRALTIPQFAEAWLLPGPVSGEAGAQFDLDGREAGLGKVACTVLEAEPPRRLALSWRESAGGRVLDSTVTFELDPLADGGTLLRITHTHFALRPVAANSNAALCLAA